MITLNIKILQFSAAYDHPIIKRLVKRYEKEENKKLYKKRFIMSEPANSHIFCRVKRLHCYNDRAAKGEIALLIQIAVLKKLRSNKKYQAFIIFIELKFIL